MELSQLKQKRELMDARIGLLWLGIGAILASGLLAAAIVLFGTFNELEMRIIGSTLTLGWYCLAASLTFGFVEKGLTQFTFMPTLGMGISGLGASLSLFLIWSDDFRWIESKGVVKTMMISFVLSFVLAHASLLLKTLSANKIANTVAIATSAIISLIGIEVIFWILNDFRHVTDFAVRLLWVLAIFGVMGSLVLPLVKKLTNKNATTAS